MRAKKAWQVEMEALSRKGLLRPDDVVEFARDKRTALHKKFTWDDTKAAHEFRLWQAREMIQVLVEVQPCTGKSYRAYVSLVDDRKKGGGGYRTLVSVLSDATLRKKLLAEALIDFDRWAEKYEGLKELAAIFAARRKVK
jgi:hypothetical protein